MKGNKLLFQVIKALNIISLTMHARDARLDLGTSSKTIEDTPPSNPSVEFVPAASGTRRRAG